jgi:hypothetical protein
MASTLDLLKRLSDHGVKYVLVEGMACVVHGSQVVTQDVDICASLTPENMSGLKKINLWKSRQVAGNNSEYLKYQ